MQIDFHHAATYVCCRLAGMADTDAQTVAHAAQYVDDATNDGPLQFKTGERYVRVTSAHKMLELNKIGDAADNRMVWVPFHFLPGNDAAPTALSAPNAFVHRMVCRPNSQVAKDLVHDCIQNQHLAFSLHRLGIALHTYVDTWAHQGFVGMISDFNKVDSITVAPDIAYKDTPIYHDLVSGLTKIKAHVANMLPVGHAGVLTLPDLPFAKWSFKRENGEVVPRDNPRDFLEAATAMFNMVRRYLAKDITLADSALPSNDQSAMDRLLRTTVQIEGEDRHKTWLNNIKNGAFSFPAVGITYTEQGPGSWKFQALGMDPDDETGQERFDYLPGFLESHWKRFHDAIQYQRLFILHELLPRHGLSAS